MFKKLLFVMMSIMVFGTVGLNASARDERAKQRDLRRAANAVESIKDAIKKRAKKRAVSAPNVTEFSEDLAVMVLLEFAVASAEVPSVRDFSKGFKPTGAIKRNIPTSGERSILEKMHDKYGGNVRNYLIPGFQLSPNGSLGGRRIDNSRYDGIRSSMLRFISGNEKYEPMAVEEETAIDDLKEYIIFDLPSGNLVTTDELESLSIIFARVIHNGPRTSEFDYNLGMYKIPYEQTALAYVELVAPTIHYDTLPEYVGSDARKIANYYRELAEFRFQDKCHYLRPVLVDEVNAGRIFAL